MFGHFSAVTSSSYRSLDENQKAEFDTTQGTRDQRRRTSVCSEI
ncbi:MAG TPA: cold shock domain-containing protein [Trebonia sp.]